ncbi:acetyltransferase [Bradyrhizobium sp. WSM471]|nr:acetyltransferase [Bradyrhizobium sp. WSM471]
MNFPQRARSGVRVGAEGQGTSSAGTALRKSVPGDENAVAKAVEELLSELGGPGPEFSLQGAKQAALRLIQDPEQGFIFVVEEQGTGQIVGVASISAVQAVRAAGAYGVLQELWISRDFRSSDCGRHLLEAVDSEAKRRGWQMIEVALPPDGYPALERVRHFYEERGYRVGGLRARKRL